MTVMIIGMLLIAFDYVISPDKGITRIDLLPDFIGYAMVVYGFFKMDKKRKDGIRMQEKKPKQKTGGKSISVSKGKSKNSIVIKPKGKDSTKESSGGRSKYLPAKKAGGGNGQDQQEPFEKGMKTGMIVTGIIGLVSYGICMADLYGKLSGLPDAAEVVISIVTDLSKVCVIYLLIQGFAKLQGKEELFPVKRMMMLWKFIILCMVCQYISLSMAVTALAFIVFEKTIMVILICYLLVCSHTVRKKF